MYFVCLTVVVGNFLPHGKFGCAPSPQKSHLQESRATSALIHFLTRSWSSYRLFKTSLEHDNVYIAANRKTLVLARSSILSRISSDNDNIHNQADRKTFLLHSSVVKNKTKKSSTDSNITVVFLTRTGSQVFPHESRLS